MELGDTKSSVHLGRLVTLFGSVVVALSSGTNYIYSAYAPQLGARLRISHTQTNIIGLAGNMGVCAFGPVWGRIIDRNGPRIPLISAAIFLFLGYLGIKQMYDDGIGSDATISTGHLVSLSLCSFMTGLGSNAGVCAAMNTTAKSFPSAARATTTGLVLSGFGLSAFWFSLLAHMLFPGDTSAFLLVLALGTALPILASLFIVKPVPLRCVAVEGYNPLPSEEGIIYVGETRTAVCPEGNVETEADSIPFLSHEQEPSLYPAAPVPSPTEYPPVSSHPEKNIRYKDGLPDIHGKCLWLTPDFYLVFIIMAICSGTGLMYINNVGSISQALYAKTHEVYDSVEAAKWQAAQVSILSLGNFAGRVLIGLISDFANTRFRLPRAYCLCIVSSLFIVSQASAIIVSSVETLWAVTLLLGLAYGALFGSYPSIMIEWFGMAHFSENCGFVSFSPVLGGNLFSLMFGYYLDAHMPEKCFDGKACYLGSLQVTLVACIISLGLSWWAGIRDAQKIKARDSSVTRL